MVRHPLAGFDLGLSIRGQFVPGRVPGANHGGSVGFGQTVDVGHGKTFGFHGGQHRRGRGRRCSHYLYSVPEGALLGLVRIDDHIEHHRCTAEMSHAVIGDAVKYVGRRHPAQANAGSGNRGQRPGKTPAVAVKHR